MACQEWRLRCPRAAWITPADKERGGRSYGSISYSYAGALAGAACPPPRTAHKTFKSAFAAWRLQSAEYYAVVLMRLTEQGSNRTTDYCNWNGQSFGGTVAANGPVDAPVRPNYGPG